jgi:hypothetical protein
MIIYFLVAILLLNSKFIQLSQIISKINGSSVPTNKTITLIFLIQFQIELITLLMHQILIYILQMQVKHTQEVIYIQIIFQFILMG